jgi:ferritin-like protein
MTIMQTETADYRTGAAPSPQRAREMHAGSNELRPAQLMDRLGERLVFERTNVKLYAALLSKFDTCGTFEGGPSRNVLEEFMREEYEHFMLLTDLVTALGADPTDPTPSAKLHATMMSGLLAVMLDARTTFAQCLEAALVAELSDNDGWETLGDVATHHGSDDLATRCRAAQHQEVVHLESIKSWLDAARHR